MIERLAIPEVLLYQPQRFGDNRGWFMETWSKTAFGNEVDKIEWLQDNHSYSAAVGTLRGLHFQIAPYAQDKLLRCLRGSLLDIAVDVRAGSPTFGRHVSAVLSHANAVQIFIPKGFAHGFVTLEPDVEVAYKVSSAYHKEAERGIAWNDPALNIDWGTSSADVTLAERDKHWPTLADAEIFSAVGKP